MSRNNIFSALGKYNSATDENYLTESFIYVLNYLLSHEKEIGIDFLNHLCFKNKEFCFDIDEIILISTQDVTEQGTPDIKVSSPDKLIYIEVKHDSDLGYRQIERYKEVLDKLQAVIKHVVLLTRYPVDFQNEEGKPYKHVRWYEIYNWLAEANNKVQDTISSYLIAEFMSFLEEKQMSMQKVGWEYINGVPAFNNIIEMIEIAIQDAQLKVHQRSGAWGAKGYYVQNTKYWCGIHFNNPTILTFELAGKNGFNKNNIEKTSYELREGKEHFWFRLPLEESHFFSLNKDEQLELITKFVKTSYTEAQKMRVK